MLNSTRPAKTRRRSASRPGAPIIATKTAKRASFRDKGDCDRIRLTAFRRDLGYQCDALIICETRAGRKPDMQITDWFE
jgi:hypothetical protein